MKKETKMKITHAKKCMSLLLVGILLSQTAWTQQQLSIDSCRTKVLEHNHEVLLSNQKVNESEELYKTARTQFLPRISANAAYSYLNKPLTYNLSTPELNLPVGSLGTDGAWTLTPDNTKNTWVAMGDSYVPLDANGQAFNPSDEPEKLLISEWANIPSIDTALSIGQHHNMLGTISLTQPVYMGGKIREMVKMAEYARNIADAALIGTQTEILYNTDEAYYRILTLNKKQLLAEAAVDLLETLVSDLENYYSEGLINRNDLLKAQVKLNEAEMNKQKVINGLKLSKMILNQMMGANLHEEFMLSDSITDQLQIPLSADYQSEAKQNRFELKALSEKQKIADSKVKIAHSQYLPNIVASANYFMLTPNIYDSFSKTFGSDWSMGLVCNIPIFHWNERHHTVRAAKIAQESSSIQLDQAQEMISLQVEQAIIQYEESQITVVLANKNIEQAEENMRIHRENMKEGIATVADVLEAEVMWQKAKEEQINARSNMQMAYTYLEKVSGTILK